MQPKEEDINPDSERLQKISAIALWEGSQSGAGLYFNSYKGGYPEREYFRNGHNFSLFVGELELADSLVVSTNTNSTGDFVDILVGYPISKMTDSRAGWGSYTLKMPTAEATELLKLIHDKPKTLSDLLDLIDRTYNKQDRGDNPNVTSICFLKEDEWKKAPKGYDSSEFKAFLQQTKDKLIKIPFR